MRSVTSLFVLLNACTVGPEPSGARTDAQPAQADAGLACAAPLACEGAVEVRCVDGSPIRTDCAANDAICDRELGCVACAPASIRCERDAVTRCRADGSGYDVIARCDAERGLLCSAGGTCADACADAAETRSYVGCEYWPTITANAQLDTSAFEFAVAISNPHPVSVEISITRGSVFDRRATIGAGAVEIIRLPWVDALVRTPAGSSTVASGAYRLRSRLPVIVYQFNPLTYENGGEHSYANDASLLLPSAALTGRYLAVSRPPMLVFHSTLMVHVRSPGFVAVTATSPGATAVTVTAAAEIAASIDGRIPALHRGESATIELTQGDVLQLLSAPPPLESCPRWAPSYPWEMCEVPASYDLTGTAISASQPVQVISGHSCAFVPFDRVACDHLEESIFPDETWGRSAIATIAARSGETNLIRVVSGGDGNEIRFDPPVAAPTTLDRGEWMELEARSAVRVNGTERLQVAQFMTGAGGDPGMPLGDPSMWLAIPTVQHRSSYQILTPDTYAESWLSIDAPAGARIVLDGVPLRSLEPAGIAGRAVARLLVDPGPHELESAEPFGVIVHGYGDYTSYAYAGGLDLELDPLE